MRNLTTFLTIAILAGVGSVFSTNLLAQELNHTQQLFASPDEAAKTLQAASEAKDQEALKRIFGSEFQELLTGDKVQDANNAKRFASIMEQGYTFVKEGDDKITLELGTNNWPMPIPLVRENGQWYFDTSAGKEEIIDRHIGKDELHAIGVCRAYVAAQQQYASMNQDGNKEVRYAQKFKSTPGKKDGLYWQSADNELPSPFGSLVAKANVEGYTKNKEKGPQAFHGYYFRILTKQGKAATGGEMNYIRHGNLTGGFALVAYPENWDHSGIMTFIVNQDGKVYQQDLGEKTPQIGKAMKQYDPDNGWVLVQDEGVESEVSKKAITTKI